MSVSRVTVTHKNSLHLTTRYLLVTSVFWLACGLARAASLYAALDSSLGILHVAPLAAGAASLLCHALAVVDIVAVICEVGYSSLKSTTINSLLKES